MKDPSKGYEPGFLTQLDKASAEIVKAKGIKLIHNGGALNPKALADATQALLHQYGVSLRIAYVEGDNVTGLLEELRVPGGTPHLDTKERDLSLVTGQITNANAYIGMGGIVAALKAGADIVICGRCTDASPVMGAATWWHDWPEASYNELAGALIAGHCIECGCYATGGNFSGHKSIPDNQNQGYPVAEIAHDGTFDVFLQEGARGLVSRDTISAQLVYEIQGPSYLNPDVIAEITHVQITNTAKNRVRVTGITGAPPPATTKLAVCYLGGYQCELSLYATGLDIPEKLAALQRQIDENVPNKADYDVLRIDQYGAPIPNAPSQLLASAQFRVFAQAQKETTLHTLGQAIMSYGLGGFCGMHSNMDSRTAIPKMFIRYEPFLFPYAKLNVRTHILSDGKAPGIQTIAVANPRPRETLFPGQNSFDSLQAYEPEAYGPCKFAPLGLIVHARSGDKGSNANVGFWVRHEDEYAWLCSLLSIKTLISLLGDDYKPASHGSVERFELPNLWAVHFLVKGILEGGVSSTWKFDGLAKSFGEYIRSRYVEVPVKFLERGTI